MRAKSILTVLFVVSLVAAALVVVRALPKTTVTETAKDQVLVATVALMPGTLLRAQDVTWRPALAAVTPDEIVRPSDAVLATKPELANETRAEVYGAALRVAVAAGAPIRRGAIVKPGDRDFLPVVLTPGARAIAIPVTTGGASTGLLSPGDRVDVILTQNFKDDHAPLTRRSVGETIVENLRVLAIDAPDTKQTYPGNGFGRTVTLEVTPRQAEKINVATELGKLSLTLRSIGRAGVAVAGADDADGVKPEWAGDVSPALSKRPAAGNGRRRHAAAARGLSRRPQAGSRQAVTESKAR